MNKITAGKLEKYLSITDKAIKGVKIIDKRGMELLDMASRYFNDAKHYKEKGDLVTSFAAVNYAHGWLDAGARLGLFQVEKGVKDLFTID